MDKNKEKIFEIAKNLYSALSEGASHTIIKTSLCVFKENLEVTFMEEEDYMAKIKFPYLTFHRQVHKSILKKLEDNIKIVDELKELDIEVYKGIFAFIDEWILDHFLSEDNYIKTYIEFIKYYQENKIDILEIQV